LGGPLPASTRRRKVNDDACLGRSAIRCVTPQRTHAPTTIVVDRHTADVLRLETKNIAMFEHDSFEDLLDLSPDAQYGLSLRYRDIFNLIDILSWNPDNADPTIETYTVPLTDDLINLLAIRALDHLFHTYNNTTKP
jgi:hypothetical protein